MQAPSLAPSFFRPRPAGITPHEHNGSGTLRGRWEVVLPGDPEPGEDDLLAGMRQKWRYNVRLAARSGVSVSLGGERDLPELERLLALTAARDGFGARTGGAAIMLGAVLVVLEAMKMEHSLSAPWRGTVSTVSVKPGDRVQEGSELVLLEPVQVDSSRQPADPE